MNPNLKIRRMAELLSKAEEDEAFIKQAVLDGTFSLQNTPKELVDRCTAIVKLRDLLRELTHEDLGEVKPPEEVERPVYDPVGREFLEVMEGKMTDKKRVYTLARKIIENEGFPGGIEVVAKTLNESSIAETLLRGLLLQELIDYSGKLIEWGHIETLIEHNPHIDFYPTLNEAFHELVRRRDWFEAQEIMDTLFLEPGHADRLNIANLSGNEKEHLALAHVHQFNEMECDSYHVLDDPSLLTKEYIEYQISSCRSGRRAISLLFG